MVVLGGLREDFATIRYIDIADISIIPNAITIGVMSAKYWKIIYV